MVEETEPSRNSMKPALVLSIFPGIDLLGQAVEEVFGDEICLVRGPDLLWGGDIKRFHVPAGVFWGIIGGPPCKPFSRMVAIARAKGISPKHPNLISEFERVVWEGQPDWFLMENVREAPVPVVAGYQVRSLCLSPHWIGEKQSRIRRFSFGTRDGRSLSVSDELVLLGYPEPEYAVTCTSGFIAYNSSGRPKNARALERIKAARKRTWEQRCELQGVPGDFLRDTPFTQKGKNEMLGNAVPKSMGHAIARAVRTAMRKS